MRIFSTFTGIGGFEIGIQNAFAVRNKDAGNPDTSGSQSDNSGKLSQAGGQRPVCVGYSEIDKYATKVYERNFPNVKNYGDITKINENELPDFDCLVGGFPCQAFSVAGKRGGFEDTRGTLFFDLARILRAKQPRLFVFENVKGLLSHDQGRTFATIIATIDELGYDCQWQVLNSKNHGVPQNRERVYIVGHLRGTPRPEVFPIGADDETHYEQDESQTANTLTANYYKGPAASRPLVGTYRTHKDGQGFRESKSGLAPTIPARAREDGSGQPVIVAQRGRYTEDGSTEQRIEPRSDGVSNTLTAVQKDNMVMIPEATKKGYAEASVGDAINLTAINSKTRRGTVLDIAPTVDTGMQLHTLTEDVRIRRLTPLECERLQGFPDNWTKYGEDENGVRVAISDSQRYKMCGNAVTTNVVQAVFERIFA